MKILKRIMMEAVLPFVFWLLVWEFAAWRVGIELLLPSPVVVWETLLGLVVTSEFWEEVWVSFQRVSLGIVSGTLAGILLGVCTHFLVGVRYFLSPVMKVVQSTPVVSFILLVLLWVPRTYVPPVVSGLMVLPLIWSSVERGLGQRDLALYEFGKSYGFSFFQMGKLVYLPAVSPYFATALGNAVSLAWKSGVAAEVICLPPVAVGKQLQQSKIYLDTPKLFAWTVVVVVLSTLMEFFVKKILGRGKEVLST